MSGIIFRLLVTAAIVLAFIGFVTLTQATAGVGLLGVACFLGILARLHQANMQQDRLMGQLAQITRNQQESLE